MTFIEYILNHTTKHSGACSLYTCKLSGQVFSWEDSDMHLKYLIKNNYIK